MEKLKDRRFSLVLMDCSMPEMDGLEATKRVRESDPEAYATPLDLPIIALTGFATDEVRRRCLDSGMNGFLTKPITMGTLEEALNSWLRGRTSGD